MILGECSLCGGYVEQPDVWFGTIPPIPTCRGCGATQELPVVKMVKGGSWQKIEYEGGMLNPKTGNIEYKKLENLK